MSENEHLAIADEIESRIVGQAKDTELHDRKECSEEQKIYCATTYGNQAIDNKILSSISDNINKMAEAINKGERQKGISRMGFIVFFCVLLVLLIAFSGFLIVMDTFFGYHVRIEFLVSVIIAIIADIFAIVQTLVKYMTNVEHYEVYNKLIDSLLKYVNHGESGHHS